MWVSFRILLDLFLIPSSNVKVNNLLYQSEVLSNGAVSIEAIDNYEIQS
jgi:hypothetical protein